MSNRKPSKKQRAKALEVFFRANGIKPPKRETPEQFEARLKRDAADAAQRKLFEVSR